MTTMAVTGANLEQLKLTGQGMISRADQLDAIIQWIDSQLPQTQWTGGHAQSFQSNWTSSFKPALKAAADGQGGLRDNGNYLVQQATTLGQATGTSV